MLLGVINGDVISVLAGQNFDEKEDCRRLSPLLSARPRHLYLYTINSVQMAPGSSSYLSNLDPWRQLFPTKTARSLCCRRGRREEKAKVEKSQTLDCVHNSVGRYDPLIREQIALHDNYDSSNYIGVQRAPTPESRECGHFQVFGSSCCASSLAATLPAPVSCGHFLVEPFAFSEA